MAVIHQNFKMKVREDEGEEGSPHRRRRPRLFNHFSLTKHILPRGGRGRMNIGENEGGYGGEGGVKRNEWPKGVELNGVVILSSPNLSLLLLDILI